MKTPFLHAAAAVAYIALVASAISYLEGLGLSEPPPMIAITSFLSLFVFSAAVMGYLFVWRPVVLLIAGEKREALRFFLSTLGSFAALILIFALIVFVAA